MKIFYTLLILILNSGCSRAVEEPVLVSQLMGETCSHLAQIPARPYEMAYPTYQPKCEATGILSSWTVKNYKEHCIVSGALCMIELPAVSEGTLNVLSNFLQVGMNDVDTGKEVFPIRGPVAIVYAKLARSKATPALEAALKRTDDTEVAEGAEFPANYVYKQKTSHPLIREALSLSNPK